MARSLGFLPKSSREHDRTLGRGEAVKLVLWRWMGGGGPRGRSERPGQDGVGGKSSLDQSRALGREKRGQKWRFQKGRKDSSWGGAVQSLKQIVQQMLEDWG